ncbi:MAG: molybdopterin molybdenumtransferase MoeA [Chloroflexi bacterium]|nr:molybdopterin molybdotransferase MoeA [Chloroflexota bacterium]MQC26893.1 molybdopterin molybdenumtransferase MoeA [Chloroflexota bacterium]
MLSVEEALVRLLAALPVTDHETIKVESALGRVLAEPLSAPFDSPAFANSSMDGFAVQATDISAASPEMPILLRVVGDIPAGMASPKSLDPGQAMRIMTGAPLPDGADTVVPVEDTDVENRGPNAPLPGQVAIHRALDAGTYVRPVGQDFSSGRQLLPAGARLAPQHVALLAMLGLADVSVHRKPRVALFSSGDELLQPGQPLGPGQIYESNSFSLAALLQDLGADVIHLGIARDNLEEIKRFLDRAVGEGADLIITSAGVSVGAHDYLRDALQSNGDLDFWRVNMRPGKPLAFGNYDGVPYIGLPGNPVSAFVSFEVFGRPALQKMSGVSAWRRLAIRAKLEEEVASDGRQSYLRATLDDQKEGFYTNLTGHQGSGNLYSLVQANCLIVIPAGVKYLEAGSMVEAWPL